ncbi:MAG TPA: uroporphyrinogen decarboxylase family protein [Victivallales bacterium]|nr:uroporphyrinogen decarboxylase family protein [Victivallales bacterium]
MKDQMTTKERWLGAIRMQELDRLPFYPKFFPRYVNAQASPFKEMGYSGLHNWIGSDKHIWTGGCTKEVYKHCSFERSFPDYDKGELIEKRIYRVNGRELRLIFESDEETKSKHPVEHPVKNLEDIKDLTAFFEDASVELDKDALLVQTQKVKGIGQDALTAVQSGPTPLMNWVQHLAGVENSHYLLADHEKEVEALFEAMHQVMLKRFEIMCDTNPADVFYLIENTSTSLISPEQYRRYCSRHIREYGEILKKRDRILVLHMCGHLKDLLPELASSPANAFEAFTSPPLGNTTLLDGRTACPDKCLVGGTNAMLWLRKPEEIIAKIEESLDELPHHRGIVVSSGGEMAVDCKPETIKTVCEWVKSYNPKF